jgi:hypothetical protein
MIKITLSTNLIKFINEMCKVTFSFIKLALIRFDKFIAFMKLIKFIELIGEVDGRVGWIRGILLIQIIAMSKDGRALVFSTTFSWCKILLLLRYRLLRVFDQIKNWSIHG